MTTHLSKSHVLAGVQDAYWSDDEGEDAECPLCLEEMDVSDMNFKPCPCGYQICRFCWHHIKENLNGRCPACRRVYTEEAVEFKAVNKEDLRRMNNQKKNKDRERKELDALGRRHLTNVRVVQRNVVYITGVGPRFAREELIPSLRSNEYFGQYGKITKILLVKRSSPSGNGKAVVGLYVTYHRREDASRAIAAVDGTPSPSGGGEITRASYGTTKYCISFLRSVACSNKGCLDHHEWGDERDCFTKEDLSTLKHAMKDTELNGKKSGEDPDHQHGPRMTWTGSAASKPAAHAVRAATSKGSTVGGSSAANRKPEKDAAPGARGKAAPGKVLPTPDALPPSRRDKERDRERGKSRKDVISSGHSQKRPSSDTALRPESPATGPSSVPRTMTPHADSDQASSFADEKPSPVMEAARPATTSSHKLKKADTSVLPSAPPGLYKPSTPVRPPTPNQSSYQPSTAAQALLDDVRSRRHLSSASGTAALHTQGSPFPDFDRTLRNLGLSGDDQTNDPSMKFSFDFDVDEADDKSYLLGSEDPFAIGPDPGLLTSSNIGIANPASDTAAYSGNFNPFGTSPDPYTTQKQQPQQPQLQQQPRSTGAAYRGHFDPFAEPENSAKSSPALSFAAASEGERVISRFGFARKPTPTSRSASIVNPSSFENYTSSPQMSSPIELPPASPYFSQPDLYAPRPSARAQSPWSSQGQPPTRQEISPGPPPGLNQSPSISMGQLFGSSFVPRDSWKPPGESSLGGPPGLSLVGSHDSAHNHYQAGGVDSRIGPHGNMMPFIDPAIMSSTIALPRGTSSMDREQDTSLASLAQSTLPAQHTPGDSNIHAAPYNAIDHTSRIRSQSRSNPSIGGSHTILSLPSSPLEAHSMVHEDPLLVAGHGSTQLLADDFPALPSSTNGAESGGRNPAVHPHIVPSAPKISESKATAPKSESSRADKKKEHTSKKSTADAHTPNTMPDDKKKAPKGPVIAAATTSKSPVKISTSLPNVAAVAVPTVAQPQKMKVTTSKPVMVAPEPEPQAPLLSRLSKKEKRNKPKVKPNRSGNDDEGSAAAGPKIGDPPAAQEIASGKTASQVSEIELPKASSRQASGGSLTPTPTALPELLAILDRQMQVSLDDLAFFNVEKINPKSQAPLQYGPLVHALSALSVGGGTFSNSLPSRSIDTAVSSFQTLLETLTQTISDLLRLLPRTTWDDSSSFDGVLRDMLKGDDFFDEPAEETGAKEDEVAALTQALERRARWMEVQLSKLEELHRDINTAAVRAVFALNDRGWDKAGFLPRSTNSLERFGELCRKENDNATRSFNIAELEKSHGKCLDAERAAEAGLRKSVEALDALKVKGLNDWC